jgi:hypothetical protein
MLSEPGPKVSEASLIECIELRQFVEKYQAAVHKYGNALDGLKSEGTAAAWRRAEKARTHAENARSGLLDHERNHGCATWLEAKQNGPQLPQNAQERTLKLFNLDTETWEPIQASVRAPAPAGALAYEYSESPVRAGWITDPEDLNARRQGGAALRYTDAGLAILREEGLEM